MDHQIRTYINKYFIYFLLLGSGYRGIIEKITYGNNGTSKLTQVFQGFFSSSKGTANRKNQRKDHGNTD